MNKNCFAKAALRRKLNRRKFLFFLTETPDGDQYLSISKFGKRGLVERRVFQVCGEFDCTPHVDGSKTTQIFLKT